MNKYLFATAMTLFATTAFAAPHDECGKCAMTVPVERILSGDGMPGDQAVSMSNGHISYRVLATGTVERLNQKYGTRTYSNPIPKWRRTQRQMESGL